MSASGNSSDLEDSSLSGSDLSDIEKVISHEDLASDTHLAATAVVTDSAADTDGGSSVKV